MDNRTIAVEELNDDALPGYGRFFRTAQQEPAEKLEQFSFLSKLGLVKHGVSSIGLV